MRLAVYTDYVYKRSGATVYAQRAFAVFLARLGGSLERLAIAGRLDPEPGTSHYSLPPEVEFVALPYYASLSQPFAALRPMLGSLVRFWRLLGEVDAAWVLGPYPLSFALVAIAAVRRRKVVLGVRQDWPRYVAMRHPHALPLKLAAHVMEAGWRLLARAFPVIVVGPALERNYRRARDVLPITVSMIDEQDIVPPRPPPSPSDDVIRVLSVGRLETEKNPLLLADVLAKLRRSDQRWKLVVVGEGPLRGELEQRLADLGVAEAAELRGYVPIDRGLVDIYRASDLFLHVSWTEGLPQVVFEAFAARLPMVATAVGGVPDAVGDAALLVPPGDADLAAQALTRLTGDERLAGSLAERGVERVRAHTTAAECRRIVDFLTR